MQFKAQKTVGIFLLLLLPGLAFSETLEKLAVKFGEDIKDPNIKIAVMDFSSSGEEKNQDSLIVRERLTTFLAQNKNMILIERALLEKAAQELKFQMSGMVSTETARKIGMMTGADAIVTGTLSELLTEEIEVNARIIQVETGEILTAGQVTVKKDWKYLKPLNKNEEGKIVPDSAQDYYKRGAQYYKEGKYSMAIEFYSKAIKLKPDSLGAYFERGIAYFIKEKYDAAIVDFAQVLELKPDFAEAYFNRGLSYIGKNDPAKAIDDFDRSLELNPKDVEAYGERASAYLTRGHLSYFKGDHDKAVADYSQALGDYARTINNCNPMEYACDRIGNLSQGSSALVHQFRGDAYKNNGEYDKAIADYNKAIESSTGVFLIPKYIHRGEVYCLKGEYDKAITDFNKALKALEPALTGGLASTAYAYRCLA